MKKVMLYPVRQKNFTFYAMVADPRNVAAVMKRAKAAEAQENQRPWSLSKVKEIALFVKGFMRFTPGGVLHKVLGLLPNAPIISFVDNLDIEHDPETDSFYVMFPETAEEVSQYANSVEIIDGQHRVLAFAEDLRDPEFSSDTRYEMIFSVFGPLAFEEKKELFMVTNEKQKKVEGNLLRLFKKQLRLLDDDEKLFDLVNRLNDEDYSPLKGRVIIGSDVIPKGYKEIQLSKILDKSGVYEKLSRSTGENEMKMCKGLSLYLQAWESVYQVSYKNPGKETLTKIAGLRYVLYMFSDILDILRDQNKPATKDGFEEVIRKLPDATKVNDVFTSEETSLAFRGEGATVKLAKEHGKALVAHMRATNSAANPADVW